MMTKGDIPFPCGWSFSASTSPIVVLEIGNRLFRRLASSEEYSELGTAARKFFICLEHGW